MGSSLFVQISFILVVAFLVASIMRLLRQPLIIGYIISGLILGPFVFDLLRAPHVLDTAAHIGIALLLFIVGLRLNPLPDMRLKEEALGMQPIILNGDLSPIYAD